MSDFSGQGPLPGQGGGPAGPSSAGAVIRRAREDAGVHIAALAVALKVPVKRLEALEADRHDLLPDAVFVRALARSVCRSLKLDPAQVLPLLPQSQVLPPTVEGRINEPFRPESQAAGSWPQVSRPALIAALVLAVAALSVYLVPELTGRFSESPAPSAPRPSASQPAPSAAPSALPTAPGQVTETVPLAPSAPAPAAAMTAPGPAPAAAPASASPAAPAAPTPTPSPSPATR